jgi:hypothetical protein
VGPSKSKTTVNDHHLMNDINGSSCTVEYQPSTPGLYEISIKYANKHIIGK